MYTSKKEVEQILDAIDAIVISWLKGEISLAEFLERYGYPVGEYALDGHESDDAGKAILLSLRDRIEVHETICGSFNPLCSAEDAKKPMYIRAGRLGPDEFAVKLRKVVNEIGYFAT